ncbi:MAG TPA: long-chain fatty acid--CoA ligase [Steroidobacteraceae bacterium]|nr:long-chain fatty acid--CoA ligase [Steroidobacteraceae bacterium]
MTTLWAARRKAPRARPGIAGDTIPELFWNAVQARGDKVILRQKDFGIWQATTWRELGETVREIALGLIALGFEPGECASILANTRKEWMFADLGVLCAGGVSNGIYPTDSPAQCEYLINDSSTVYAFVEDEEQLDKILEVRTSTPQLRKIFVIDLEGLRHLSDPQVMSLNSLCELGRAYAAQHPGVFEQRIAARRPDDLAILVYTSGTTGRPKGAMISHRNLIHVVRGYYDELGGDESDEKMCFLPLCHIAERVGGEYFSLYNGAVLNFVENPDTVPENVREIAPTTVTAVPRVWEKFYSAVTIAIKEATALQQAAYRWAIGIGARVADLYVAGKPIPWTLKASFTLGRWLALDNVRKLIGIHRAKFLVTGAAPISPDLVRWYLALGIPMLEVWGQTECAGAATFMPIDRIKPGSIGKAARFTQMTVSPEGELLVRGDNVFMGYLNQPQKTAETIRNGWLHTGDVGAVDEEGFYRITDRMKDIIITAGGKNITPSEIENQLKFSPYITDAVVIGDRRAYLTALIMIDQENVEQYAQEHDIPFSNYASLCRASEIQRLIQGEIDRVNRRFARAEQIKTFRLIEQRLTAEDEELTPTMKLKRKLVQQKYAELIESMYSARA